MQALPLDLYHLLHWLCTDGLAAEGVQDFFMQRGGFLELAEEVATLIH